jgi:hypothetical protein
VVATGRLDVDPLWAGFFAASAVVFLVCSVLKKAGALGVAS